MAQSSYFRSSASPTQKVSVDSVSDIQCAQAEYASRGLKDRFWKMKLFEAKRFRCKDCRQYLENERLMLSHTEYADKFK